MTLQELIIKVANQKEKGGKSRITMDGLNTGKKRISKKMLFDSGMEIVAELTKSDWSIRVFEDGCVLYEAEDKYTVFSIEECGTFEYSSLDWDLGRTCENLPYIHFVYDRMEIIELDWYIGLIFVGEEHIKENSDKRNYYVPLENMTFDGSEDYGEIKTDTTVRKEIRHVTKDFTEDVDTKVDVSRAMERLPKAQNAVLHSKYWEDKSYMDIGLDKGSEYNVASQRAKAAHDRGISSIKRYHINKLHNYKN